MTTADRIDDSIGNAPTSAPLRLHVGGIETPLGRLVFAADDGHRLHAVVWAEEDAGMRAALCRTHGEVVFAETNDPGGLSGALRAYFDGDIVAIDKLDVAPAGTPFQLKVWAALREIRAGQTWSYGDMARYIGHAQAFRAVGLACNANPVGVVIPCHRVVGSGGALVGFGGGLPRKQWLLAHESGMLSLPLF